MNRKRIMNRGLAAAILAFCLQIGVPGAVFTTEVTETGEKTGILCIREEIHRYEADEIREEPAETLFTDAVTEIEEEEEMQSEEETDLTSEAFEKVIGETTPVERLFCEDRIELAASAGYEEACFLLHIHAPEGTWFEDGTSETIRIWDSNTEAAEFSFSYEGTLPAAEDFILETEPFVSEEELFAEAAGEPKEEEEVILMPEEETKADLSVEVTADRSLAGPGDTICWHICIQNTGDQTLTHVETELRVSEGIEAVYVLYPETVQVIEEGRIYEISEICPGEIVNLEAEGMIQADGAYGSFWMTARLSAKESGVEKVSEKAQVEGRILPTPTPVPLGPVQTTAPAAPSAAPTEKPKEEEKTVSVSSGTGGYEKHAGEKKEAFVRAVGENPRTGDNSPLGLFLVLMLVSAGTVILIRTFRSH